MPLHELEISKTLKGKVCVGPWTRKHLGPKMRMVLGNGGIVKQHIHEGRAPRLWNWDATQVINIQVLNAAAFKAVTGMNPPYPRHLLRGVHPRRSTTSVLLPCRHIFCTWCVRVHLTRSKTVTCSFCNTPAPSVNVYAAAMSVDVLAPQMKGRRWCRRTNRRCRNSKELMEKACSVDGRTGSP